MDKETIIIKMAVNNWQSYVQRTQKLFDELGDEKLMSEIAPGKNRGIYLLGHLAAYHDALVEILGLGTRNYPELYEVFLQNPDRTDLPMPGLAEVKEVWYNVHERLDAEFARMQPADWFARHNAMTDEDFDKDPSRNKLNVLLNRTGHLANHYGQLLLLK